MVGNEKNLIMAQLRPAVIKAYDPHPGSVTISSAFVDALEMGPTKASVVHR
jgi:hypothetical protein